MMNGIEIRICPMIDRPWRLVEPPLFPGPSSSCVARQN